MRTTLDLPDELLKRAKIAAIERGVTLRELIGSALVNDLGLEPMPRRTRHKLRFPLFASARPGTLELGRNELAEIEAEEDLRRHGLPR